MYALIAKDGVDECLLVPEMMHCVLSALDAHLNPMLIPTSAARPTLDQMIGFCISALRTTM